MKIVLLQMYSLFLSVKTIIGYNRNHSICLASSYRAYHHHPSEEMSKLESCERNSREGRMLRSVGHFCNPWHPMLARVLYQAHLIAMQEVASHFPAFSVLL